MSFNKIKIYRLPNFVLISEHISLYIDSKTKTLYNAKIIISPTQCSKGL